MDMANNPPRSVGQMRMAGIIPTQASSADTDLLKGALKRLQEYKSGKSRLEARIKRDNDWWRLRNDEGYSSIEGNTQHKQRSTSSWLVNSIMGKHADAMDAYPHPNILPREQGDRGEAQKLSSIVPVVLDRSKFSETYSACMWDKCKHGTGIYSVCWDSTLLNGMGDISITRINPLNIFWEPGVEDIEDSREVFHVQYADRDSLMADYPQYADALERMAGSDTIGLTEFRTDDYIDKTGKVLVVDWYRKERQNGSTILRYIKFCGELLLYDSAMDENNINGFYADGEYPFVFDALLPQEGTPCGYGYIDLGKGAQSDIDILDTAILRNAVVSSVPRYFSSMNGGINEQEFVDLGNEIVHVTGNISDTSIRPIDITTLPGNSINVLQQKVDELKQVTSNQDVLTGNSPSGVTAASGIAALQESAGRTSKDATRGSYRAFQRIVYKVIERIRQFYDLPRQFRIMGQNGIEEYISYTNEGIAPQMIPTVDGTQEYRLPVFDIEITAEKESPYTRIARNELVKELFSMGLFSPQAADQATTVLKYMDFDGKQEMMHDLALNGSLFQQLVLYQQMALALAQKYEPQTADGLAQAIMGKAGMPVAGNVPESNGQGANVQTETGNPNESTLIRNARERSAQSTQL